MHSTVNSRPKHLCNNVNVTTKLLNPWKSSFLILYFFRQAIGKSQDNKKTGMSQGIVLSTMKKCKCAANKQDIRDITSKMFPRLIFLGPMNMFNWPNVWLVVPVQFGVHFRDSSYWRCLSFLTFACVPVFRTHFGHRAFFQLSVKP